VFNEKLLEKYMIEGPVFSIAAGLVSVDVAQDPRFKEDMQGMLGRTWVRGGLEEKRGECLDCIRNLYRSFEETILADGRGRGWLILKVSGVFFPLIFEVVPRCESVAACMKRSVVSLSKTHSE